MIFIKESHFTRAT